MRPATVSLADLDAQLPAAHRLALGYLQEVERLMEGMTWPDPRGGTMTAVDAHRRSIGAMAASIREHGRQVQAEARRSIAHARSVTAAEAFTAAGAAAVEVGAAWRRLARAWLGDEEALAAGQAGLEELLGGQSLDMAANTPNNPPKDEGGDMPRRSVPAGERVTDTTLESVERGLDQAIPEPEDEGSSMAERAQEVQDREGQ